VAPGIEPEAAFQGLQLCQCPHQSNLTLLLIKLLLSRTDVSIFLNDY
jgi:hypothetical protein